MAFLTVGDGDFGGVLRTNVLGRIYVTFEPGDALPATITFAVKDGVTGAAVTIYDSAGTAIVTPVSMTVNPSVSRVYFTPEFKIKTAGNYVAVIDTSGPAADFEQLFQVTAAGGLPSPTMNLCVISDHIVDPAGAALENVGISARVLSVPKILTGAAITTKIVQAFTDSAGYFSLSLIQGVTADVIIPEVGYRRTLIVPSTATANLFSIA
tara:strand:- start:3622 stop:4251 length:630 start_codon:yes stop_codon:yes gene_type:complete